MPGAERTSIMPLKTRLLCGKGEKMESYWFYCEDFNTAEYLATLVKQDGGELVGDILYDFGSSLYGAEFLKENKND